jgi:hypothetical protein
MAGDFVRLTQDYIEVWSTGNQASQYVRLTQQYLETWSTGDSALQYVRETQEYLEVVVPFQPPFVHGTFNVFQIQIGGGAYGLDNNPGSQIHNPSTSSLQKGKQTNTGQTKKTNLPPELVWRRRHHLLHRRRRMGRFIASSMILYNYSPYYPIGTAAPRWRIEHRTVSAGIGQHRGR